MLFEKRNGELKTIGPIFKQKLQKNYSLNLFLSKITIIDRVKWYWLTKVMFKQGHFKQEIILILHTLSW